MAIWIDIAASLLMGALLGLGTMRLNADMTTAAYSGSLAFAAQSNADALAEILEDDLRKAGYGAGAVRIAVADSAQLRLAGDLDADGSVDTLHYYLGAAVVSTPNPNDFALYRAVAGSAPQAIRAGLTDFRLSYYGASGDSLAAPVDAAAVRSIRIQMRVESPVPYDGHYARTFSDLRVSPKNLTF